MTISPLVSVVITTFNREQTLTRSINSVLSQTFKNFEIIVVDDGSADGTRNLLSDYIGKEQIRYFYQNNKGAGAARNLGIKKAKGKYIAFQDSDDEWLPEKLVRQVEKIEQAGSSVGVVYCDMWKADKDHNLLNWGAPQVKRGTIIDDKTLDYQALNIGLVTALVRREYLEKVEGFDENLPRFIDLDMFIRLSNVCDFCRIPQPFVKIYSLEGISSSPKALAIARKIMLKKYYDQISRKKVYLANQYIKIAEALWKASEYREAKRYCLMALRTYPYNARITAKAIVIPFISAEAVGRWPVSMRKRFY